MATTRSGLSFSQDLLQRRGDEAGLAVGAVVGADDEVVAVLPELVLPEHEVLVPEADDAGGAVARLLEGAQLRVDRRDAEAAAHEHDVADLLRRAAARRAGRRSRRRCRPACSRSSSRGVVLPSVWTTIVMVPFLRSKSATVSGMRSPPSRRRSMTKWPGWAAAATSGASTSQRKVVSEKASRRTMEYDIGVRSLRKWVRGRAAWYQPARGRVKEGRGISAVIPDTSGPLCGRRDVAATAGAGRRAAPDAGSERARPNARRCHNPGRLLRAAGACAGSSSLRARRPTGTAPLPVVVCPARRRHACDGAGLRMHSTRRAGRAARGRRRSRDRRARGPGRAAGATPRRRRSRAAARRARARRRPAPPRSARAGPARPAARGPRRWDRPRTAGGRAPASRPPRARGAGADPGPAGPTTTRRAERRGRRAPCARPGGGSGSAPASGWRRSARGGRGPGGGGRGGGLTVTDAGAPPPSDSRASAASISARIVFQASGWAACPRDSVTRWRVMSEKSASWAAGQSARRRAWSSSSRTPLAMARRIAASFTVKSSRKRGGGPRYTIASSGMRSGTRWNVVSPGLASTSRSNQRLLTAPSASSNATPARQGGCGLAHATTPGMRSGAGTCLARDGELERGRPSRAATARRAGTPADRCPRSRPRTSPPRTRPSPRNGPGREAPGAGSR